jgi:uncharacterized spore protein YtfJ
MLASTGAWAATAGRGVAWSGRHRHLVVAAQAAEDGAMAVDVRQIVEEAREVMTGRRVYSEPYERNGVTVILASRVQGGGGGGGGQDGQREGSGRGQQGWGGGFGVSAAPVGAFVIRGDDVRWVPAMDLNKAIMGAQLVAIVTMLTLRKLLRGRRRHG